jgi:excisionase family DNA binding protein
MEKQVFFSIEFSELQSLIEQAVTVAIGNSLPELKQEEPEEILSRQQVADIFGRSLVTIHDWMNKGLLPYYRMNRKVYFKRSEVMAAMKKAGNHRTDINKKGGAR